MAEKSSRDKKTRLNDLARKCRFNCQKKAETCLKVHSFIYLSHTTLAASLVASWLIKSGFMSPLLDSSMVGFVSNRMGLCLFTKAVCSTNSNTDGALKSFQ